MREIIFGVIFYAVTTAAAKEGNLEKPKAIRVFRSGDLRFTRSLLIGPQVGPRIVLDSRLEVFLLNKDLSQEFKVSNLKNLFRKM